MGVMEPMSNGTDGRDNLGRFAKGNEGGPGGRRPGQQHIYELKKTIIDLLTADGCARMRSVWEAMATKAAEGDTAAARLVAEYSIGRPALDVNLTADGDLPLKLLPQTVWDCV